MWRLPIKDTRIDIITQAWNIIIDAPKNRVEKSRLVKQVLSVFSDELSICKFAVFLVRPTWNAINWILFLF